MLGNYEIKQWYYAPLWEESMLDKSAGNVFPLWTCHETVHKGPFTSVLLLLLFVLPVRGEYIHVSHKGSYRQSFMDIWKTMENTEM